MLCAGATFTLDKFGDHSPDERLPALSRPARLLHRSTRPCVRGTSPTVIEQLSALAVAEAFSVEYPDHYRKDVV